MSRMLALSDAAWASARTLATAGRRADALAVLTPLVNRPGLPAGTAAKAHRLAAALHLDAERYAPARRHLRAAAKLEPGNADTHFQLGRAFENDPHGCDARAARHYRRAASLDRGNAAYLAALGRAWVRVNEDKKGLAALRKAVELAPADAVVLAIAVEGYREVGKVRRAWAAVCRARFLAPADAAVGRLWSRAKFDLAAAGQTKNSTAGTRSRVLPFVRLVCVSGESRVVRRDSGSVAGPHIGRR